MIYKASMRDATSSGFTLIECMIYCAISVLLIALSMQFFVTTISFGKKQTCAIPSLALTVDFDMLHKYL